MSPADLKDMLEAIQAYGLFVTFVVIPGLAMASLLALRYVKSRALRLYHLFEKTEKHAAQFQSLLTEIREAVTRFDGVFVKHVQDTERLSKEDHWKNCRLDKCPHLPRFFNKLEGVAQETRDVAEVAKVSREQTRELISILMRRLDDLFVQQIALLRRNGWDK